MPSRISLVVEDDSAVRGYITAILHRQRFQTVEAEDGAEAIEIIRKRGVGVDLVITDIEMPGMDGLTLARNITASHPTVAVVLISGRAKPDDGFHFVQKPFLPHALLRAIEKALDGKSESTISL